MIGIDIVEVARIAELLKKQSFIEGVFTQNEYAYYLQKNERAETLAGIFAAKEALLKSVGTGINLNLTSIEVAHTDNGQPYFVQNKWIKDFQLQFCLSITHTKDIAIAVCVALPAMLQ